MPDTAVLVQGCWPVHCPDTPMTALVAMT